MKLLFCKNCEDVFKVPTGTEKSCECGLTSGKYFEDGYHAKYTGEHAVPLAISNFSFEEAVHYQPEDGTEGEPFEAFVVPMECKTFIKTKW